MAEFKFRLQRVLDYRGMVEGWAKDAYLEARAARLAAAAELEAIEVRRGDVLRLPAQTLEDRLALQALLDKLDGDELRQKIVIEELEQEEEKRKEEWSERRKELQALEKLRDRALAEWTLEESRREQKQLDDWTTTRRAA